MRFIFVNGKPGAGKDTQAEEIEKSLPNSAQVSTGAILRDIAEKEDGEYSHLRDLVDEHHLEDMRQGIILPAEVIGALVDAVVQEGLQSGIENFIFTGFPRSLEQLDMIDGVLGHFNGEARSFFLNLDIADETARTRQEGRLQAAREAGTTPRKDDEPAIFKKRMKEYYKLTHPMLHVLKDQGRLLSINGEGTIEQTTEGVRTALGIRHYAHPVASLKSLAS